MGCSACSNFEHEQQSEMINENSSQIENNIENINSLEEKMNTEYINLKQKRENEIFDFFIDIRQNPKKYIEEYIWQNKCKLVETLIILN